MDNSKLCAERHSQLRILNLAKIPYKNKAKNRNFKADNKRKKITDKPTLKEFQRKYF